MAVEITSSVELEKWLEDKPEEWAQVIALRAALRTFPLLCDPSEFNDLEVDVQKTLSFIFGMALSTGDCSFEIKSDFIMKSTDAHLLDQSGELVGNRPLHNAMSAASETVYLLAYPWQNKMSAANAVEMGAMAIADKSARLAFWQSVSDDCHALGQNVSARTILKRQLWKNRPNWFDLKWLAATSWLSGSNLGFEIWREWYYGRLEGLSHAFANFDADADEAFYKQILSYDDDWWSREPREVNADIKELVDSLRKLQDTNAGPVDFFISYANEDEATAREIGDILDELGRSYLVQYRDFAQKNWVNAIDDALERSGRLVPIYSRHYVASDHCKTEWNHFHKLDPSGAERRIVGFKLDGADLRPLMDQVVYKDLSSVSRAERTQTIRDWIEWEPRPLTRNNVAQTLTKHLDPGVVATDDGKIDTTPDPVLNETDVPAELARAMDALRMMLDLARMTERNLSSMMQGTLKLYDNHFSEQGRDSSWGGLDRYMAVLSEGAADLSSATMREEKAALEQLIAAHSKCMAALNSIDEQMRELANVPLEKVDPAAINQLIDKLKDVQEQASEQEASTDQYNQQAAELVEQGREFAFEAGAPDAEKKPDTARKRFLRYVGGFGLKTLAVLGSLASIRQTPEFKRLLEAAESLVEEFYKMIGL